jgi:hydrogenase maturation protease
VTVRVIGVGHVDRGDDAVGLAVADRLRVEAGDTVDVRSGAADAAAVLAQLEGAAAAIAVDCARGGGSPGSILCLSADIASWPTARGTSSHGNALADALALGAALECLPARLTVFAVVGERFGPGDALSAPVRAAIPELARRILEEATCMRPA